MSKKNKQQVVNNSNTNPITDKDDVMITENVIEEKVEEDDFSESLDEPAEEANDIINEKVQEDFPETDVSENSDESTEEIMNNPSDLNGKKSQDLSLKPQYYYVKIKKPHKKVMKKLSDVGLSKFISYNKEKKSTLLGPIADIKNAMEYKKLVISKGGKAEIILL